MQNAQNIRREYVIEFKPDSTKVGILIDFLINYADTIRLTRIYWRSLWPFSLRKFGSDQDPIFTSQNEKLKNEFIKKEINNKKYNDVEQGRSTFEHHFYKLDKTIAKLIQDLDIFFNAYDHHTFYGFEDPTFYKQSQMIAAIISHHRLVLLNLTEDEKTVLEKEGLQLVLTTMQEGSGRCLLRQ